MAGDLSTLFPSIDSNNAPLGYVGGMMLGDMFNLAKQNNTINQQQHLGEEQRAQQMQPLDMAYKQAQTGYQTALGRQANQQADTGAFDLEQKKRLADPTYSAALAKLRADASDSDIKAAQNRVYQDMLSPDPQVREHAVAMHKMFGDMQKMYEQEAEHRKTAYGVANIQASATRDAAGIRATAKGAGAGGRRPPRTLEEQLAYANQDMQSATTQEEYDAAKAMATQALQAIIAKGNAQAPAWTTDASGKLVENPVKASVPQPVIAPPGGAAPAPKPMKAEPNQENLEFTAKKYGMTVEQVKAKLGIK